MRAPDPEASVLIVGEVTDQRVRDLRLLLDKARAASRALADTPHEVLLLQRQALEEHEYHELRLGVAADPRWRLVFDPAPHPVAEQHALLASLARGRRLIDFVPGTKSSTRDARILVVVLCGFGDCVLALAPLAALRARHPDAQITVLTGHAYAWIFAHDPAVAEVLTVASCAAHELAAYEQRVSRIACERHGPFDQCIVLGDRGPNARYQFTGLAMHEFYCVQAGVGEGARFAPTLALPGEHRAAARARLDTHGIGARYAVLHTRGGWAEKNPPDALFREIIATLVPHLPVVIVGGKDELLDPRALSLAGRQPMAESVGVIAGAALYVGPDSGSLHAASALDVPVLGIYAGTGMRVSPLFSRRRVSVQSPASCALPCGSTPCVTKSPCAPALTIEHLRPHLHALLAGDATPSEWVGDVPALWFRTTAGMALARFATFSGPPVPMPSLPYRIVTPRAHAVPVRELALKHESACGR